MESALVRDAASYAEAEGIPLEDAVRRLEFQETIGEIQPALMADLSDSYGGLWIEHQPEYRIVIALTEGDRSTIASYIEGKAWVEFVEVREVQYSMEELQQAHAVASSAAHAVNVSITSLVDIVNNRVEVIVGNPDLLMADLEAASITLPESVIIVPVDPVKDLPDTNQGVVLEATTSDGRTIYLPNQPPTAESMAALMEGTLLETNGCLRVTSEGHDEGFLILWPFGTDIRAGDGKIELINSEGKVVARVGDLLRIGGGAMESATSMANSDDLIPGMPIDGCPGPYWVAGELESLVAQLVADVYVDPYSSGGRLLALFIHQSRPVTAEGAISGDLTVDDQGCMQVDEYTVLWPPGVFPREEPLRLVNQDDETIALVGATIQVSGSEKGPEDYRYFENKVRCRGPYWGAAEVSALD
jgi:hypothetical protein